MTDAVERSIVYRLARALVTLYLRLYHRFRVTGAEHVPREGGCIIACNHASFLDPPVVACGVAHRRMHFLARDTLWHYSRVARWFFTQCNCIPVDRTRGDVAALRTAVRVLKQGKILALFPEGTRSRDGEMQEGRDGIGFVAAKAGVPIVPAYVDGTFRAFPPGAWFARPAAIHITYGRPIPHEALPTSGDRRPSFEAISLHIMERIAELKSGSLA